MKKRQILGFFLFFLALRAVPEVTFGDLNLSPENDVLFSARADVPEYGEYEALFVADLGKERMNQLSFFPEEIMLLEETGQLQIQNRFGVFRTDEELENMAPISRFPAFVYGRQIQTGKINPIKSSPNGRYLLYLDMTSPAYAELLMIDLKTDRETLISSKVEMNLRGPQALWSEDSKFFIYAKGDKLYYFSIDQLLGNRLLSENLRTLGKGFISSVRWGRGDRVYYISGSLVYEIASAELFTRSLYQELLKIGRIVGKIPFIFDPNFDSFWISPDGGKILFNKGGRNIFLYFLQTDDFLTTGETVSLPYLFLPRNTRIEKVIWTFDDQITLLAESIENGEKFNALYRLNLAEEDKEYDFRKLEDEGIHEIVLSPDEISIAALTDEAVLIKNYRTWETAQQFLEPSPIHAVWIDEDTLVSSGWYFTRVLNVDSGSVSLVSFSQVEQFGFGENRRTVQVKSKDEIWEYSLDTRKWSAIEELATRKRSVANESFRVYLESLSSGSYRNMVMVRNVKFVGTHPLFLPPERRYEPFPAEEEPVDFDNFSHGSRIRRREVALVFNAIDSVEGLTEVLNILNEYGVQATFFINGDFIRRHPGAVKEISSSGHEVGSLFYTYFNLTDPRFKVDKEFIKKGLAKNEDDYFAVTGLELSLLWHAPFYFVSPTIIDAAAEMGYSYIGRDVDSLDWVEKRDGAGIARLYFPASDLLERVIKAKKPGSIISMRIGKPGDEKPYGGRDDYLFTKMDLLLNHLISLGYSVAPVSTLMDHAR